MGSFLLRAGSVWKIADSGSIPSQNWKLMPNVHFSILSIKFCGSRTEVEETEDELSGLEKGSLLHNVLFEFYNNRRTQKRPPIGHCDADAFKDAETELNELLAHKAKAQRNDRKEKLIGEHNLFWKRT